MGFKAGPRTVTVRFGEGHPFHGAEARVRLMSFGEWETIAEAEQAGEQSAMEEFAKRLVSWNLTDEDDQEIPATGEGLRLVDVQLVVALKNAWIQSLNGVHDADPLPQSSPSGEPSPVESIPTEALSESLAS
jgi:hypothetical protein